MENDKGELIYQRKSPVPGLPTYVRLYARKIPNNYPEPIKSKHRTIFLEIQHAQQCPGCERYNQIFAEAPFAIADQVAMWKAIINVIYLPEEKTRKIKILKDLIKELEQDNFVL